MLTLSFTLFHVKQPSFILTFPHTPGPIPNPISIPKTQPCWGLSPHFKLGHQRKVTQVVLKQIGVVSAKRRTKKSCHTESDSGKDLIWVESGGVERENVCGAGAGKARWILCGLGSCQIIIFQMLEGEGEKQEWREKKNTSFFNTPLFYFSTLSSSVSPSSISFPALSEIKDLERKPLSFIAPPPPCVWPHVSRQRSKTKKAHLSPSQLPLHNSW